MDELNPDSYRRYEDAETLRRKVEKTSRRSLTEEERHEIAPALSGPYDDTDVAELINAVRTDLPPETKPSQDDKARAQRRAQERMTALEAKELVEELRMDLFLHRHPPFRNKGVEAAEWIESQVENAKTKRLSIEVAVPANLDCMASIVWLGEYLKNETAQYLPITVDNDSECLRQFLSASNIKGINWSCPVLEYLGVNPEGEMNIKRVWAPDGSMLGRLQGSAVELAKATKWEEFAAVHHLLTGGISAPQAVQATSHFRAGREAYGKRHRITVEILDPDSATHEDIIKAFKKTLSDPVPSALRRPRQRARVASRSALVATFVEETQGMSWRERLEEWNRRNPEQRFRTDSAIKQAHYRATHR
ncbi:MAG: hypothetical protein O7E55_01880 [Chloroflexi bacterium]|nr:hypothetical protein [Chloroflexota bacterium]